jgi:hypothetical protein
VTKVNGYELICPICKGKDFDDRTSMLNSRGMTFLGLDWANQGAINYICSSCGYIFWFIDDGREYIEDKITKMQIETEDITIDYETSQAEDDECPVCFCKRGNTQSQCLNCGYIFK